MEVCKHRHTHALTSRVSCVLDFRVLSKQGMLTLLRATPASSLKWRTMSLASATSAKVTGTRVGTH